MESLLNDYSAELIKHKNKQNIHKLNNKTKKRNLQNEHKSRN